MLKRVVSIGLALAVTMQGGLLNFPVPVKGNEAMELASVVEDSEEDFLTTEYVEETTYYYEPDSETTTEEPPLTLSQYTADTCEEVSVWAYYPGAEELRLYVNGDWDDVIGETVGEEAEWTVSFSESGTYEFYLAAYYEDEEGWTDVAWESLEVEAPYGAAEAPVFDLPFTYDSEDNLLISWSDDYDNAFKYTLTLEKENELWWKESGSGKSFTIPRIAPAASDDSPWMDLHEEGEEVLEPGIVYDVHLAMEVSGYDAAHSYTKVFVPANDGDISLAVNYEITSTSVKLKQGVPLEVIAPEEATAILLYDGDNWGYYEGNSIEFDEYNFYSAGQKLLVAKYTTDDVSEYNYNPEDYNWSGSSNIVYVDVEVDGTVPEPEISLWYNSISRGDDFGFTVENAEEIGGFYWAVYDQNEECVSGWNDWNGESSIHSDSMWRLEKSQWVTLHVEGYGMEGYWGNENTVTFYVKMTKSPAPDVSGIPSSVSQGEPIVISIDDTSLGEDFYAWIWDQEEGTHSFYHWDGIDTIYLPTFDIPVGECELYVEHSGQPGYGVGSISFPLEITEPVDETYLTVSKYTLYTNEIMEVTAFAPGAEQIDLVVYNMEYEEWTLYNASSSDSYLQTPVNVGNIPGSYYVSMKAYYPDKDPEERGIVIEVEAPYGPLSDPVFEGPAYVFEGEPVYLAVYVDENASSFRVNMVDVEEDTEICSEYFEGETAWYGDFEDGLEGGHTYEINAYASGIGYTDVSASRSVHCLNDDEVRFEAEVSSALIYESFDILCLVPDAEAVEIEDSNGEISISTEDIDEWDWRECCFSVNGTEVGTLEFRYRAKINGRWSVWSDPIEVEITADGIIEDPELSVPEYIEEGEPLFISMNIDSQAEECVLWIEDVEEGDHIFYTSVDIDETNYEVEADCFESNKTYRVYLEASRRGYVKGYATVEFFVTSYEETNFTLSISPNNRYAIGEENYMVGYIDVEGADISDFRLDLWQETEEGEFDEWTEDWHLENDLGEFFWSTRVEGNWSLRVAMINENGYQISPWSDWVDFVAFDAENLDSVILPEDLRELNAEALSGIAAERIVIPENVSSIEANAFADCGNLQVVEFLGTGEIEIDESAFDEFTGVFLAPQGSTAWEWCRSHGGCMAF